MPGFQEIMNGHWSTKCLFASSILVLLGGAFTIYNQLGGSRPHVSGQRYLKCADQQCGYVQELDTAAYKDLKKAHEEKYLAELSQQNPELAEQIRQALTSDSMMGVPMGLEQYMPQWGMPNWPLPCSKCGQETAIIAIKCQKCGEIFLQGADGDGRYPDRCPKCKYSRAEERIKQYREAKKAAK